MLLFLSRPARFAWLQLRLLLAILFGARTRASRIALLTMVALIIAPAAYAQTAVPGSDASGTLNFAAASALALIITQLVKPITPAQFYPLVSAVVGIAYVVGMFPPASIAGIGPSIFNGVLAGLAASGTYAAGKHIVTTNNPGTAAAAPAA